MSKNVLSIRRASQIPVEYMGYSTKSEVLDGKFCTEKVLGFKTGDKEYYVPLANENIYSGYRDPLKVMVNNKVYNALTSKRYKHTDVDYVELVVSLDISDNIHMFTKGSFERTDNSGFTINTLDSNALLRVGIYSVIHMKNNDALCYGINPNMYPNFCTGKRIINDSYANKDASLYILGTHYVAPTSSSGRVRGLNGFRLNSFDSTIASQEYGEFDANDYITSFSKRNFKNFLITDHEKTQGASNWGARYSGYKQTEFSSYPSSYRLYCDISGLYYDGVKVPYRISYYIDTFGVDIKQHVKTGSIVR